MSFTFKNAVNTLACFGAILATSCTAVKNHFKPTTPQYLIDQNPKNAWALYVQPIKPNMTPLMPLYINNQPAKEASGIVFGKFDANNGDTGLKILRETTPAASQSDNSATQTTMVVDSTTLTALSNPIDHALFDPAAYFTQNNTLTTDDASVIKKHTKSKRKDRKQQKTKPALTVEKFVLAKTFIPKPTGADIAFGTSLTTLRFQ
jgi:hypothetical protein